MVIKPAVEMLAPRERLGPAGKPKVPARVYALDKTDVEGSSEVVEGTLLVTGKPAKVLIDPGSMHSFIRPRLMKGTNLKLETLPYTVEVSTPTWKQTIESDKLFWECEIRIGEKIFLIDLISLGIHGYDVILGMDLLAKQYVYINCRTKEVSLCLPGEPILNLNFQKAPKHLE